MSAKAGCKLLYAALIMAGGMVAAHAADDEAFTAIVEPGVEPETLVLWNRRIVTFRATVGGNSPQQRVENSRARIRALSEAELAEPIAAQATRIGAVQGIIVSIGGQPVFGVVSADLDPEATLKLDDLAARAVSQLEAVRLARQEQRRASVWARGVASMLLSTLLLVLAIWLILAGRERAVRKIDAILRGRQLAVAGIDIVPTLATVERATFRVLSWAMILAGSYVWLTFVLQQFPYTAPLGQRLGAYVLAAGADAGASFVAAIPRLLMVIGVLMVTRAVSLWASRLLAEIEHGARTVKWLAQEQARATRRIANGIIWITGIAIAYPLLPWSQNPVFQGMSVVIGLAVSLASTGLMNQWISGLVILYARSFRVGDYVMVGDVEGTVTDIGALATKLRTVRREEITLPNTVLTADRLTNLTRLGAEVGALLSVSIAIGYDAPWQQVRDLLLQAAASTSGVRREPPPRVLQWELSDFFVRYQLHVYLERAEDRIAVRSELNSRILDVFAAAGVQIMTPHFESQPSQPVVARTVPTVL